MLLWFSSQSVWCDRPYHTIEIIERLYKKLLSAMTELEELQPAVQQKTDELNSKHTYQTNGWHGVAQNDSLEWPSVKKQTLTNYNVTKVKYPINIDLTPVEIPSVQRPVESGITTKTDSSNVAPEKSSFESFTIPTDEMEMRPAEETCSMISFETVEIPVSTDIIKQPSPPPVVAEVQDLTAAMSPQVTEAECQNKNLMSDGFDRTEPLQLHISMTLMDNFMKLAQSNTDKNLETCGVLAGSLKNRKFYATALIIANQESTSDSCQTTDEEEIFEVQDKRSLFPLGWIHTHPTQSCFISSIDVHTYSSYQKAWNFQVENTRRHVSNKTVSTTWLSSSRSTS